MKKFLLLLVVAVTSAFTYFAEAATSESELKAAIKLIDNELPMRIDDDLVWQSASYSGNYVTFTFKFDENEITADQLDSVKSMMKEAMVQALFSDPNSRDMLKMLTALNKGLTLNFIGSRSGKKVPISITPSELKKLL